MNSNNIHNSNKMTEYNPFDKDLENLDEQELQKLIDNSISEGWYVEFKSDIPKKQVRLMEQKL